jgi:pimeloyl-ACP methyl ester carboxylesterase
MQPQTAVRLPDGRRYNMVCMGEGAPVVILAAGFSGWSPDWRDAQPEFAKTTRVCAVDRAGYGFSNPGPMPRDSAADVSDLYQGLKASGLPGPYVLVGHSLGGLEMRLFAYRHPELVSGLLLIDPAIEHADVKLFQSQSDDKKVLAFYRYCLEQARAGKIVAGELRAGDPGPCVRAPHPKRTEEEKRRLFAVYAQPSLFEALASKLESLNGRSSDEIDAARRKLGAIPLIVLSADKAHFTAAVPGPDSSRAYDNWIGAHEDDARDSVRGQHRIVEGAGHQIYGDRPDAVLAAFREVVDAVRASGATAASK